MKVTEVLLHYLQLFDIIAGDAFYSYIKPIFDSRRYYVSASGNLKFDKSVTGVLSANWM